MKKKPTKEQRAAWDAAYKARHPMAHAESMRKYRKTHPEQASQPRRKEHKLVEVALNRGSLIRPDSCQRCHVQCKPVAHHPDYSQPLLVKWVCRSCHAKEHREMKRDAANG